MYADKTPMSVILRNWLVYRQPGIASIRVIYEAAPVCCREHNVPWCRYLNVYKWMIIPRRRDCLQMYDSRQISQIQFLADIYQVPNRQFYRDVSILPTDHSLLRLYESVSGLKWFGRNTSYYDINSCNKCNWCIQSVWNYRPILFVYKPDIVCV